MPGHGYHRKRLTDPIQTSTPEEEAIQEATLGDELAPSHLDRRRSRSATLWCLVLLLLAVAYFALAATQSEPGRWRSAGAAFGAQVLCFAAAALLLGWRRGWSLPRISDPGLLFLLWTGTFFVYPSGVWLRGGIPPNGGLASYVSVVFLAHGVFVIVFMVAFLLVAGRRYLIPPGSDARLLPSGRALVLVPLLALTALAALRIFRSGTLLPSSNYGDSWFAMQSEIRSAQTSGGLTYIATQILGKGSFYANLALGVGCGLAGARVLQSRSGRLRILLGLLVVVILALLMGITTRSGALGVGVIALLLADLITGLVRWRYVLPALVVGLAIFAFFGVFRTMADQGLDQGVSQTYRALSDPRTQAAASGELQLMLWKDAMGAQLFNSRPDGPTHLLEGVLGVVPSQLLPSKLASTATDVLLGRALLGPSAVARGSGVAGSVIADGFRAGGLLGVGLSAMLLGSLVGAVYRWLNSAMRNPPLLKLALFAGYMALGFMVVRGDVGLVVVITFYNVIVPWVALRFILQGRSALQWLAPITDQRRPHASSPTTAAEHISSAGLPP